MNEEKTRRIITPMSHELVEAIDEVRFENRLPSRSAAIRSLIELALQTLAQGEPQQSEKT